ncbi:MAG TPA: hypothetical protein VFW85_08325 [Gaiellaceae bacterium]|nr:hypothetical protein [Gaiellaceae bacterium]
MKTVAIVLSVPLILEFVFAPMNLWTGRTIGNFVRFTGFDPWLGKTFFAPVKLATAALLAAGLAVRGLSIAGAAAALAVSTVYVARLLGRTRRDPAGLFGFTLFGALAGALLAVRLHT